MRAAPPPDPSSPESAPPDSDSAAGESPRAKAKSENQVPSGFQARLAAASDTPELPVPIQAVQALAWEPREVQESALQPSQRRKN